MDIPKFLKDIIDNISIANVFEWLAEIPLFLARPKYFYRLFIAKGLPHQASKVIFYTLLLLLVHFGFSSPSYEAGYKAIYVILMLIMPFCIINSLTLKLTNKYFVFWHIFSYCYIIGTLYFIPILIFSNLFLKTENYTFYFISNLTNAILFFSILFLLPIALTKNFKKAILAILLNICFVNVFLVSLGLIIKDNYSNVVDFDPIMNELFHITDDIKSYPGKPKYYRIEVDYDSNKTIRSICFEDNDTVKIYGPEHLKVLRELYRTNVKILDSLRPKLIFNRNKKISKKFSDHYKLFNTYFDYEPNPETIFRTEESISKKDKTLKKKVIFYEIEDVYFKNYYDFRKDIDDIVAMNDYATTPTYFFGIITYPINLILEYSDIKTTEEMTIQF
ncbi:hypothetical protein [Flavobacterium soli]|uniref:hypothetical protein n=1 Tax=Flavobacterium soli TaxID=344881 RepID=UPI00040CE5AE|nr:hypothetical protein [Flavobacterium soli]